MHEVLFFKNTKNELDNIKEMIGAVKINHRVNCTEDFLSLASWIMTEENLRAPKNIQAAKSLFLRLITVLDSL